MVDLSESGDPLNDINALAEGVRAGHRGDRGQPGSAMCGCTAIWWPAAFDLLKPLTAGQVRVR
jgi:hypothetical protein